MLCWLQLYFISFFIKCSPFIGLIILKVNIFVRYNKITKYLINNNKDNKIFNIQEGRYSKVNVIEPKWAELPQVAFLPL